MIKVIIIIISILYLIYKYIIIFIYIIVISIIISIAGLFYISFSHRFEGFLWRYEDELIVYMNIYDIR